MDYTSLKCFTRKHIKRATTEKINFLSYTKLYSIQLIFLKFIHLTHFIFGCVGSSLLRTGFL